jgi:uncharacterized NAD(P)/FAD-binding protein YdhS
LIDLAIVGAGAASVSFFANLFTTRAPRIKSVIFVEPGELAEGLAFNRREPYVLCNTSAAVNSLFPDDDTHFVNWLWNNPGICAAWQADARQLHGNSFVPRGLFGRYLAAQFHTALRTAEAHGVRVDHLRDRVRDITPCSGGLSVHSAGGMAVPARNVVVGTGLGTSNATARAVLASGGLMRPISEVRADDGFLPANPAVVVIGCRQSAIDAALVVAETRPDAFIVLMSRSGRFPAVRSEMAERPGGYFTAASLVAGLSLPPAEIVSTWRRRLIADAVSAGLTLGPEPGQPCWGVSGLQHDLSRTLAGDRAWERVDRNAVTVANQVWPFLTHCQRVALRSAFDGMVRRYVSAIPVASSERVLRLHREGRLRVTRGPGRWRTDGRRLEFEDYRGQVFLADRAIDTTGFSAFDSPGTPTVLGRPLTDLHQHVEPGMCRVPNTDGSGMFLLGPPLGDTLAVTNYMNATARQAASVASFFAEEPVQPIAYRR